MGAQWFNQDATGTQKSRVRIERADGSVLAHKVMVENSDGDREWLFMENGDLKATDGTSTVIVGDF